MPPMAPPDSPDLEADEDAVGLPDGPDVEADDEPEGLPYVAVDDCVAVVLTELVDGVEPLPVCAPI